MKLKTFAKILSRAVEDLEDRYDGYEEKFFDKNPEISIKIDGKVNGVIDAEVTWDGMIELLLD